MTWQSVLWPRRPSSSPRLFQRLGRVLHWCMACLAAALSIGGLLSILVSDQDPSYGLAFAMIGIGLWFTGRAVRYILSAE